MKLPENATENYFCNPLRSSSLTSPIKIIQTHRSSVMIDSVEGFFFFIVKKDLASSIAPAELLMTSSQSF